MGAVPKKKPSLQRSRRRRRAFEQKLKPVNLVKCPHCQAPKLSHRVCLECGQYRGKQITAPKTKVRKVA